jgi:hypothetical protein
MRAVAAGGDAGAMTSEEQRRRQQAVDDDRYFDVFVEYAAQAAGRTAVAS